MRKQIVADTTLINNKNNTNHICAQQSTILDFDITNNMKVMKDTSSTFVKNMSLPIHRWFRYSAGFSAEWVEILLKRHLNEHDINVLDPFCGSGTVLISSEHIGAFGIGVDSHPFISKVTRTKLLWRTNVNKFRDYAQKILREAKQSKGCTNNYPKIIYKCYPDEVIEKLDSLKRVIMNKENEPIHELTWLALVSIIRAVSPVGTAQWQYVLPKKSKKNALEPFSAFKNQIEIMSKDMKQMQTEARGPKAIFYQEDARECKSVPDNWADLVITSPPYCNNYDYADATRLEMSFFGEVNKYGDLQKQVRKHLIRSCTQHVSGTKDDWKLYLNDQSLYPIKEEIKTVCEKLSQERLKHGGKKNYHKMIAMYFHDLAKVWYALRRVCKEDSTICFVVGDSAPYGIYVPVDRWLGKLALEAGFKEYRFEKTRDRNVKWKNRKHRVRLHEGRLWIKG